MENDLIRRKDLAEGIACHKQYTDQEYETDRQWAIGYNAGIERALFSIRYARKIDAVEVVRCNDCMQHNKCTFESWFSVAGIKNGYCCMGKRRDE